MCGLRDDGGIICWKRGGRTSREEAGPFVALGSGDVGECGIRSDGSIACPERGIDRRVRAGIPTDGGYVQVTGGNDFACALRNTGAVSCWGEPARMPPPLQGSYQRIEAGGDFICGLTREGRINCTTSFSLRRLSISGGPFVQLATENQGVCGLQADGQVRCSPDIRPEGAPMSGIRLLSTGERICGIDQAGAAHCWSRGSDRLQLPPPGSYSALTIGYHDACALLEDRSVQCWGEGQGMAQGEPSLLPPESINLRNISVRGRAKSGQVSGVEVSFQYAIKGGSDRADTYLIGRLIGPTGVSLKANPVFRQLSDEGGALVSQRRLDSRSWGLSKRGSFFFPYFAMDLPPGEHQAKVAFEGQVELQLGKTRLPVPLEGAIAQDVRFTKPPAKMVRLGVRRIEVAEGSYDTVIFARRSRARPDLAWYALFDLGRGVFGGTIHTSPSVQDSYRAAWDQATPTFPLSEGDRLTINVMDIDVAKNDLIARFDFSLDELEKAAAGQPLSSGRVLAFELGTVEVR
jgi:hypothetical protein